MSDLISRQQAIYAMGKAEWAKERLRELPSAEAFFDKGKVANLLYCIYEICSPHTNAMDVATRNSCFKELGKELFGDDIPEWMQR